MHHHKESLISKFMRILHVIIWKMFHICTFKFTGENNSNALFFFCIIHNTPEALFWILCYPMNIWVWLHPQAFACPVPCVWDALPSDVPLLPCFSPLPLRGLCLQTASSDSPCWPTDLKLYTYTYSPPNSLPPFSGYFFSLVLILGI